MAGHVLIIQFKAMLLFCICYKCKSSSKRFFFWKLLCFLTCTVFYIKRWGQWNSPHIPAALIKHLLGGETLVFVAPWRNLAIWLVVRLHDLIACEKVRAWQELSGSDDLVVTALDYWSESYKFEPQLFQGATVGFEQNTLPSTTHLSYL